MKSRWEMSQDAVKAAICNRWVVLVEGGHPGKVNAALRAALDEQTRLVKEMLEKMHRRTRKDWTDLPYDGGAALMGGDLSRAILNEQPTAGNSED